ncbi:vomeronasal type-2 receptor 26-like [Eleutherodactylus coqui]|uniref:vomeronasal type-2 receptor 26-like n=1 Tax=Eleutherodactylus coqui TaxID=57060 RepID=UPI003462E934
MNVARKTPTLPSLYDKIRLFIDLLQAIMEARRGFAIARAGIVYRWGFPTKIIATRDNATHIFHNPKEATNALNSWGIQLQAQTQSSAQANTKRPIHPDPRERPVQNEDQSPRSQCPSSTILVMTLKILSLNANGLNSPYKRHAVWKESLSYNADIIPVSRCSDQCSPGSRKKAKGIIRICCYDCVPCAEGEISNITDAEDCIKCQNAEWPNEKRDRCLPKVLEFISYHNDPMASVFSGVSVFGCLVTSFIFGIFISYQDTPIVKANNRNLSYLLLIFIILSFLSIFLFLGRPSDVTCRLRETSFGIFFSVAVSSLLAKTTMVCVAFKSTKPGSPWRKWLSVKMPYSIVLLCSSIQIVICVTWLSVSPPFQDLDSQSYPGKIIIQCNEGSDICFYSMLGYMGFLAVASFVLAFMARTLPDSFNEAKYITFSMLLFCSVWISMIPAYLSTRGKYMVAVEIFAVMASSAGLLGCVFFPKCFIILFRSEMNRKTDLLGKRKE